jgi:hypothetical protein
MVLVPVCAGLFSLRASRRMRRARIAVLVFLVVAVAAAPASAAKSRYVVTPVMVGVGGGSTLTFEAPGKQAGVLAAGGFVPGAVPGKLRLSTDYMVRLGNPAAALALGDIPGGRAGSVIDGPSIDSCEASGFRTTVGRKSVLTFLRTGAVNGSLVLTIYNADLGFGCADGGGQTFTIPLTGKLGIQKLARVVLDGQATGVKLPGGVVGNVRLHLITQLRLS